MTPMQLHTLARAKAKQLPRQTAQVVPDGNGATTVGTVGDMVQLAALAARSARV